MSNELSEVGGWERNIGKSLEFLLILSISSQSLSKTKPDVAVLEPENLIHKILCNLVGPVRLRYWNGVFGT